MTMRYKAPRRSLHHLVAVLCLMVAAFAIVGAPAATERQKGDDELKIGQEVFNKLKAKGEIVESSPLYDQLRPITDAISRVAQPRYDHPLKFYLVHEAQPN